MVVTMVVSNFCNYVELIYRVIIFVTIIIIIIIMIIIIIIIIIIISPYKRYCLKCLIN